MSSCLLHLCLLLPFQVLFEFSVHTLHPLLLGKGQSTMNPGDEASDRPIRLCVSTWTYKEGASFHGHLSQSLGTTELCYQDCVGRQMST